MSTTKKSDTPPILREKDYKKYPFHIPKVNLEFIIDSDKTKVTNTMHVLANTEESVPLELKGEEQELLSVSIDGTKLDKKDYEFTEKTLTIPHVPRDFTLTIQSTFNPGKNNSGSGLYKAGDNFLITQCESEGFRKITYHPDRPDVMSRYSVEITADKEKFPVLLSNPNLVEQKDLPGGKHFTKWDDPFLKPSYLFALVAGDLEEIKDSHTTASGKEVDIRFYVTKGNKEKAAWAVESLKESMKWDEEVFGLECDLNMYMVVSTDKFNMGAMENKGLNVFNDIYVLANPKTATDANYEAIQAVIAHEYFHNWTGNRVTCRDWFQLTLKEGLTVYRDQRFTADHTSRVLKRIKDVRNVKGRQFPEDSGPNAHPIKPAEVAAINNFYTPTVYEKGAEVIRMIATLIGEDNFKKGMDKYFELYDGQAVTTEDFVSAMELGSSRNLTQFKRWYHQAGTPTCKVDSSYDADAKTYSLTITQSNKTKDGGAQKPLHIPFEVGLVGEKGEEVASKLLELTKKKETFVFEDVEQEPTPSLLRNFTAPVKVEFGYTDAQLAFLMGHDKDLFNRYEAGQRLASNELRSSISSIQKGAKRSLSAEFVDAFGLLLDECKNNPSFVAEAMILPTTEMLVEDMKVIDYQSAHQARKDAVKALAIAHEEKLKEVYDVLNDGKPWEYTKEDVGKRSLKSQVLKYLFATGKKEYHDVAFTQFDSADNMTDCFNAFSLLGAKDNLHREEAIKQFYSKYKKEGLAMDKWLTIQAMSERDDVLQDVIALQKHDAYDEKNPNKIRSLIGAYALGNVVGFHHESGHGYQFVASEVKRIDKFNPQVAARLATYFGKYSRMDEGRKNLMKDALQGILDSKPSDDVYEIVSKTLAH